MPLFNEHLSVVPMQQCTHASTYLHKQVSLLGLYHHHLHHTLAHSFLTHSIHVYEVDLI